MCGFMSNEKIDQLVEKLVSDTSFSKGESGV